MECPINEYWDSNTGSLDDARAFAIFTLLKLWSTGILAENELLGNIVPYS
jgi:hypothetical protein